MRQWPDILPRMGEVIRPDQFWATHYAAFQIAHKRAKGRGEAVLRPEAVQAAYEELKVLLRQERASRQYGLQTNITKDRQSKLSFAFWFIAPSC
jgi:hypothetical protein